MKSILAKHYYLILSILLATFTSFFNIGNKSLYLDEGASLGVSKNWDSMLYVLWNFDGNMWLYYFLMHYWQMLGTSESFLRSFSVITSTVSIIPIYFLAKRLLSSRATTITMLLIPMNLFFVKTAQYARGYSLLLLLTSCNTLLFTYILRKRSAITLLLYSVLSALSIYTHIYAVFVIVAHITIALIQLKKRSTSFVLVAITTLVISILPLLISPALHSGQINWIKTPTLFEVGVLFITLLGDFVPLFVISIIVLICFIYKRNLDKNIVFILVWLLVPIICSLIISLLYKPIFSYQYFTISLIPIILLLSAGLASFNNKKILSAFFLLVVLLSLTRLGMWYQLYDIKPKMYAFPNQTADWRAVSKYIAQNNQKSDAVIVSPSYAHFLYDYYIEYREAQAVHVIPQPNRLIVGKHVPFDKKVISSLDEKYQRVWYIEQPDLTQDKAVQSEIKRTLSTAYKKTSSMQFTFLQITLYEH